MNAPRWFSRGFVGVLAFLGGCAFPRPAPVDPLPRIPASMTRATAAPVAPAVRTSALLRVDPARDSAGDPDSDVRGTDLLTLGELQRLARERNPIVEEWAARVRAIEERGRQVRAAYFPALRTRSSYLQLDDELSFVDPFGNSSVIQDRLSFSQTTTLSYNLLDWGRTHYSHQAQQREAAAESARRQRAEEALDFQVAGVYFGLLGLDAELETVEEAIRSLEGNLKLARDLLGAGRATRADVLVVEARVEQRRFAARLTRDLIQNEREELARLLDRSPDELVELGTPVGLEEPTEAGVVWETIALERRADLRALDAAYQALRDARRAELATFLPTIDLFAEHEYSTTESIFGERSQFRGGFSASWELFAGGRRRARAAELGARADELLAGHRRLQRQVVLEVREAVRALHRAHDRIRVAEVVVRQAEENLEQVRDQFREGRKTGQELLEAETLLNVERSSRVRAFYEAFMARSRLLFAAGIRHVSDGLDIESSAAAESAAPAVGDEVRAGAEVYESAGADRRPAATDDGTETR